MAERTHAFAEGLAEQYGPELGVLATKGHRSPTVTSITLPVSLPGTTLVKAVKERGFTIGSGYGKNRETTVRIGHMGDHTLPALERCLAAVGEGLHELLR
jgi:aspartate aminotransferase-like enzyme